MDIQELQVIATKAADFGFVEQTERVLDLLDGGMTTEKLKEVLRGQIGPCKPNRPFCNFFADSGEVEARASTKMIEAFIVKK